MTRRKTYILCCFNGMRDVSNGLFHAIRVKSSDATTTQSNNKITRQQVLLEVHGHDWTSHKILKPGSFSTHNAPCGRQQRKSRVFAAIFRTIQSRTVSKIYSKRWHAIATYHFIKKWRNMALEYPFGRLCSATGRCNHHGLEPFSPRAADGLTLTAEARGLRNIEHAIIVGWLTDTPFGIRSPINFVSIRRIG